MILAGRTLDASYATVTWTSIRRTRRANGRNAASFYIHAPRESPPSVNNDDGEERARSRPLRKTRRRSFPVSSTEKHRAHRSELDFPLLRRKSSDTRLLPITLQRHSLQKLVSRLLCCPAVTVAGYKQRSSRRVSSDGVCLII